VREELEAKLRGLEERALGGDPRMVERQHNEGKLTARERVDRLLDPGSFVEEFMLAETQVTDFGMAERRMPSDGVVAGAGTIDGRPVYVFAPSARRMAKRSRTSSIRRGRSECRSSAC
jgi:acetyl-CoA carboxylase carboxyltransferase component